MNRFERHPILTAAALVLLAAAGLLALSEWMLTPSGPGEKSLAQKLAPPRHLRLREWPPGTERIYRTPPARYHDANGPVDDSYRLTTDANGFIEPSVRHARPDFEIAFLGGSTTECLYIRPDDRFPALAGRLLEERSGLKINALNAARSGNNAMHSLLIMTGKVLPRRPRYVVMMHATNDIGALAKFETYWSGGKQLALVRARDRGLTQLWRDVWAITLPHTYEALGRGVGVLKAAIRSTWRGREDAGTPRRREKGVDADETVPGPPPPGEKEVERRKALRASFEPALRSFVGLARAWGARPVLMTQVLVRGEAGIAGRGAGDVLAPEELRRGDFDRASFATMHDYANMLIRHVAASENALLVDLAAARVWSAEDVYDGLHFTTTGSRRAAEVIANAIAADMAAGGAAASAGRGRP